MENHEYKLNMSISKDINVIRWYNEPVERRSTLFKTNIKSLKLSY